MAKLYQTHLFGERLDEPEPITITPAELLLDFASLRWEPDTIFKLISADCLYEGKKEPRIVAYQLFQECYGWKTSVHTLQGKAVVDFMPALIPSRSKWEAFKADGLRGYILGAEKKVIFPRQADLDYDTWHPGDKDLAAAHEIYHYTGTIAELVDGLKESCFDFNSYCRQEARIRKKKMEKLRKNNR